jgi:hypothetical protein
LLDGTGTGIAINIRLVNLLHMTGGWHGRKVVTVLMWCQQTKAGVQLTSMATVGGLVTAPAVAHGHGRGIDQPRPAMTAMTAGSAEP